MPILVPVFLDKQTGELYASSIPGISGGGGAEGVVFEQSLTSATWTIVHGQDSDRVFVQIYDSTGEFVLPDEITIVDLNTIQIEFTTAMAGTAHILFFTEA